MKVLFFFLVGLFSSVAYAEDVYTVDVQKIVAESIIGKAAKSNLEAEMKKSETKVLAQKQEIEKLAQDFNKQKAVLSKEALEQKAEALRKKERDLKLVMSEEQDKVRRKNSQELEKVITEIKKILTELAEEKEYKIIIEKDPRMVVYANPKYDITAEVIKFLDEKTVS